MKKLTVLLVSVFAALCLFGCGLSGESQRAYDYIVKASDSFKDPSSVRIIKGGFIEEDDGTPVLIAELSAKNGYGSRDSDLYEVHKFGLALKLSSYDMPDDAVLALHTNTLDIDGINKKLQEKFSSFD